MLRLRSSLGLAGLSVALAACATGGGELGTPVGSVGAGASPALEALVRENGGGAVAMVLPPLSEDRPERVVLARLVAAPPSTVLALLRDVERYPEIVDQIANVVIREAAADELWFDAELVLPFNNLEYSLRYAFSGGERVDVVGVGGVLEGGRWCWQALPRGDQCLVVYTSEGELIEDTGFVLRRILDLHPDLQPGLAFAQGLRLLHSICDAAERSAREGTP